jgi:hypothetical protein
MVNEHPRRLFISCYGRLLLVISFRENYDVYSFLIIIFGLPGPESHFLSMVFWLIQSEDLIFSLLNWLAAWLVRWDARIGFLIYRPVGTRNSLPATRFITGIT